jgi:hypothetical protein
MFPTRSLYHLGPEEFMAPFATRRRLRSTARLACRDQAIEPRHALSRRAASPRRSRVARRGRDLEDNHLWPGSACSLPQTKGRCTSRVRWPDHWILSPVRGRASMIKWKPSSREANATRLAPLVFAPCTKHQWRAVTDLLDADRDVVAFEAGVAAQWASPRTTAKAGSPLRGSASRGASSEPVPSN